MSQLLPYSRLHSYLCGVDRLTGEIKGFAFELSEPQAVPGAAGATQSLQFNKVESYEELSTALSVDARAEARFGLFDGSGSLSFDKSMSINSYSIFVYAVARVERAFQQVVAPVYQPAVAALLRQPGGAVAFRAAFGDWFVRGMATGGQLMSLIEIRTRDQGHRRDIDSKLKGSYGYAVSADTSVKSNFSETVKDATTNIVEHQVGGSPRRIARPEDVFDALMEFTNELAAPDCTTAVPYQVGCVAYETVPIPDAPPPVDVQQAEEVLDALAQLRKGQLRALADVQYVLTNQDEFVWGEGGDARREAWVAELNEVSRRFIANLAQVEKTASAVTRTLDASLVGELQRFADVPSCNLPSRLPGDAEITANEGAATKDALMRSRLKTAGLAERLKLPQAGGV